MKKTKVGVIGLGSIAQLVHLPNIAKLSNAEITAVSEIDKRKLTAIADKFNISIRFSNYKEFLKNSDVDSVIITTPSGSYSEFAIKELRKAYFNN